MFFNSIEFAIFLPLVFLLYWFVFKKSLSLQNSLLLVSSYIFYSFWDYRFLFLLMFSTLLDYVTGLKMSTTTNQNRKKLWFWLSIGINLGFLGFFKYYNFFVESFAELLASIGIHASIWTLKIILPVGISFYTFHGLSYVIDIYKNRIKPTTNFIDYALFVSFFPLLVAGPIERATHLLPQIEKKRSFDYSMAADGMRQILWGIFKKVVVADNCALFVNNVFQNYQGATSLELILGTVFFAFQIYCDFSGYTDIALGTARLFGFTLLTNFRTPYFARDIAEFWRRWHISLTTWFRDYLYIPLGGSRHGKWRAVVNTFIVFIVSGFWHGANWTFIAWGFLNALYFLPLLITGRNRTHLNTIAENANFPSLKEIFQVGGTFLLVCISWVFFRSDSLSNSFDYLYRIFNPGTGIGSQGVGVSLILTAIFILIFFEWIFRHETIPFKRWSNNSLLRYSAYTAIIFFILFFGAYMNPQSFIYFQF